MKERERERRKRKERNLSFFSGEAIKNIHVFYRFIG
jgi:hypothetical protein